MYLSQQIEVVVRGPSWHRITVYKVHIFRVVPDPEGVPMWVYHDKGPEGFHRASVQRADCDPRVPFLPSPALHKRVTASEASRLTGLAAPVCLDKLTETLDNSEALQNYQRPKKNRKPGAPPTKLERARAVVFRAQFRIERVTKRITQLEGIANRTEQMTNRLEQMHLLRAKLIKECPSVGGYLDELNIKWL